MKHEYDSNANQSIKDKLIRRDVIQCVSMLVYNLVQNAETFEDYHDDLYGAYEGPADYEEAASQEGWEQAKNGVFYNNPGKDVEINETADDYEELCEEEGIDVDGYRRDIFEHWIVAESFARQLEKQGHKVLRDFFGLTVWCRPTTGQAISMDYVIDMIAENMEILEGQKNHKLWI